MSEKVKLNHHGLPIEPCWLITDFFGSEIYFRICGDTYLLNGDYTKNVENPKAAESLWREFNDFQKGKCPFYDYETKQ